MLQRSADAGQGQRPLGPPFSRGRPVGRPVAYAGFSGSIPEGLYEAGEGSTWDHGTFENLDPAHDIAVGLDAGKLSFVLHGEKRNGRFSLVRMRGRGEHARSGAAAATPVEDDRPEDGRHRAECRQQAERAPARDVEVIRKAKRGGRAYVDVLQNAHGHHAVPPYVLRAVPGATVSTPLRWAELTADLDPTRFALKTVPARLTRRKADPLEALAEAL